MIEVTTSPKFNKALKKARKTKAYLIEAAELDREHIETLLKERDALKSALKEAVEALESGQEIEFEGCSHYALNCDLREQVLTRCKPLLEEKA